MSKFVCYHRVMCGSKTFLNDDFVLGALCGKAEAYWSDGLGADGYVSVKRTPLWEKYAVLGRV